MKSIKKHFAIQAIFLVAIAITAFVHSACNSNNPPVAPEEAQNSEESQNREGQTYEVSFETGERSTTVPTQTISYGEKVKEPKNPIRFGYVFGGWYTDPETSADNVYSFSTLIEKDLALYAKWIKNAFTVSFRGDENGEVLAKQVIVAGQIAREPQYPVKEGHTFLNWYVSNPSASYNFRTPITTDVTLYANWQRVFTVSFKTYGGSELSDVIVEPEATLSQPTDPKNARHGGTFVNWYSDAELEREYNFSSPVTEDITLYAKWSYMVTYDEATNTITGLAEGSGDRLDLVIPSNINGLMIDKIGDDAFKGNTKITSLIIADGIKVIGARAFAYLNGGSKIGGSLAIPNSVETIGELAFFRCDKLTGSLTLSSSLKTMGERAFQECSGFKGSLNIPGSLANVSREAFKKCSGFDGVLTIDRGVETIGESAFQRCSGFTGGLDIPSSVSSIEDRAFEGCSSFEGRLNLPQTARLGNGCFEGCGGLALYYDLL